MYISPVWEVGWLEALDQRLRSKAIFSLTHKWKHIQFVCVYLHKQGLLVFIMSKKKCV